jgi:hydroxymethylbilane synthase
MILTPDGGKSHDIEVSGGPGAAASIGRDAGMKLRDVAGPDFFISWG